MSNIRIVLVEPAGELNLGSVARIMKNMGLTKLVLVNPQCDRHSEDARRMAVHAVDILENAIVVDSLPVALTGCQRAIATTVRSRSVPIKLEPAPTVLPWLLTPNVQSALLFGAEERGLSNDELKYAQRFISIPSNPDYPSLNLAQAVAICSYELYQTWLKLSHSPEEATFADQPQAIPELTPNHAPIDVLEGYYQHLESVLLKIGYLHPHTVPVKMEKFRRLYNKANLQPEEVAMLRGILRQVRWAIKNQSE
ncbi:RNA methyltransferase [Pleurocapsa sp. FMAR1]|uniref:RNA methyltransferase n=1 Tax=Pleurocapsa sp. FMAR1 TaxID=3040204 RepID=UPI0029C8D25D|nr:RNA methyltransferase [Pleurocapsa sp. FMAR1]